jgi:membrane associated rhomboid family serine protease
MRSRYPATSNFAYSFGPGPLTPAIKVLIAANTILFVVSALGLVDFVAMRLGFTPAEALGGYVWQFVSYMFLHGGLFHILFNMLALWMFGVELERMWGSRFFTKYYFVCGVGAAFTTLLVALMFRFLQPGTQTAETLFGIPTIGASGAIYGVLLAYALYFPDRPIYMYLVFPIPAKYFVMIIGAISLLSSMGGPGSGVAHTTHLGGLVAGYLYLKSGRMHLIPELKYRFLKWRINRMRRRFDVYSGGRADDVDRRVH